MLTLPPVPTSSPSAASRRAAVATSSRALTAPRTIGENWLVTAGLKPGDKVVVEGAMMLRPGMPVKAVPYNPNAAPAQPGAGPAQGQQPQGQQAQGK